MAYSFRIFNQGSMYEFLFFIHAICHAYLCCLYFFVEETFYDIYEFVKLQILRFYRPSFAAFHCSRLTECSQNRTINSFLT